MTMKQASEYMTVVSYDAALAYAAADDATLTDHCLIGHNRAVGQTRLSTQANVVPHLAALLDHHSVTYMSTVVDHREWKNCDTVTDCRGRRRRTAALASEPAFSRVANHDVVSDTNFRAEPDTLVDTSGLANADWHRDAQRARCWLEE